jgi:NAD(P)-dependent dehydrogenase (short-subunit alcohol dehydrogenase family)
MGDNILITGTSYGLGVAISSAVRARGDRVFSVSRTPPRSKDEVWIAADLGDLAAIEAAVKQLVRELNDPLSGVVLNAALADKTRSQWTIDQVDRHFRINALGPFALWSHLTEAQVIGAPCNVVLMGSFVQSGNVRQPAYAMSKAALWSWMRSFTMAQDIDHPVSMNMIWPGRIATPGNPVRQLPPGDPNAFYPPERVANAVLSFLYQAPGGPRGTVVDLGRS